MGKKKGVFSSYLYSVCAPVFFKFRKQLFIPPVDIQQTTRTIVLPVLSVHNCAGTVSTNYYEYWSYAVYQVRYT